jgi:predicted DNA-binding protein with PD1-like motif
MKFKLISLIIIGMLFVNFALFAQGLPGGEVITEGSSANNDSVPEVYTLEASFERVVIVRFKYRTDILEGLKEAVARENIKNAVILSCAGSVIRYHVHAVNNAVFPSENIFVEKNEPMDVISMNGYIIDGRVHAHLTLANEEKAVGGHLEPKTLVFSFCIVTIGVLSDETSLTRLDDKTWR